MKYKDLELHAEKNGWTKSRQKGSHVVFTKAGAARPIIVARRHGDIPKFLLKIILKQIASH